MLESLSDKHAVEGIAVQRWQAGKMHERAFLDWQRRNPVGIALPRQVFRRPLRERQLAKGVLDDGLPNRSDTQVWPVAKVLQHGIDTAGLIGV